ncbi:hypothetical protein ACHQM5_000682 [Ranunculus cassubicifolius]
MDRINDLPDSILLHILSFLEVDEAVATSVLSKQWRDQWRFNPSLHFPSFCQVAVVDRTLNQYHAKQLQTLFIEFDIFGHPSEWLDFAIDRKVEDITVRSKDGYYRPAPFRVPSSMFSYPCLQALTLDNCQIYPPDDIKCVDSLRRLSLKNVLFVDGVLSCLLSKFHCLQTLELTISDCKKFEVPLSCISRYRSLQALTLEDIRICPCSDIDYFDSLKLLSLKSVDTYDGALECLLSKCPSLKILELSFSSDKKIDVPNAIFSYPSLQALTLSNCNIHPPLDIKCCDSLKHLTLKDVRSFDGAIDCLLSEFHSLQTLYVDGKNKKIHIPASAFSSQSLHTLTLRYCQISPPSDTKCLDSLEQFTLYDVTCFDGALDCLLSKFDHLQTIFVHGKSTTSEEFNVPESIFSSPFLQDLTLISCRISSPSHIKCSESLKCLSLKWVTPVGGVIDCLLSKCRRLQTLELGVLYSNDEPVEFCMALPDLRSLSIGYKSRTVKIDAPKLQHLTISGGVVEKIDIQSAPQLEEVRFTALAGSEHANYLGAIAQHNAANIKTLYFTEQILEIYKKHYKNGRTIVFNNLKEFHLVSVEWRRSTYSDVVGFFRHCPSLEEIRMNFQDTFYASGGWGKEEWETGIQIEDGRLTSEFGDENFLGHLRILKMVDVSHSRWQFGLIKFLLKKASVLEVLHIKLYGIYGDEEWSVQDKQESMIKCIRTWPKKSPNAIMDIVPQL